MTTGYRSLLLLFLVTFILGGIRPQDEFTLTLTSAHTLPKGLLVFADLPETLPLPVLSESKGGSFLPVGCQVDPGLPTRVYWTVGEEIAPGATRTYHTRSGTRPHQEPSGKGFEILEVPGSYLEVRLSGRPLMRYNSGLVQPPPTSAGAGVARDAYIHPVWTPRGRVVTDDFPPDHLHQRGIWFAWTETLFEGRSPDFWNLGDRTGTVTYAGTLARTSGEVFARLQVMHRHLDLTESPEPLTVLNERWQVTVSGDDSTTGAFCSIDIESRQDCATPGRLVLPEYRYGGMAFRGARDWNPDRLRVLTSERHDRKSGDGDRSRWGLMSGPIGGDICAVLALSHPSNFRAPQPLRVHPEAPYFVFSPMRLGQMQISPGETYVSRYRFIVFDRDISPEEAEELWQAYADPPQVTVTAD